MSELNEAIETVSFWVDQWANDQAELDEVSQCDQEERKVILAVREVLAAVNPSAKPSAIEFLRRAAANNHRIVSSGDLCRFQIAEAQANGLFFVDETGLGFALLPWDLTTDKDRQREQKRLASLGKGTTPDTPDEIYSRMTVLRGEIATKDAELRSLERTSMFASAGILGR